MQILKLTERELKEEGVGVKALEEMARMAKMDSFIVNF